MKSTLFRLIVGTALGLGPVHAMYDAQEEDKTTPPQTKAPQQGTSREKTSTSTSFKEDASFKSLPDELCMSVFSFLDIGDLGQVARVSTRWKRVTEDPILWRHMGSRYYGDYLSKEDLKESPKQKVISHYLSVVVFAATDLEKIDWLVRCYGLNLYTPSFKKYEEKDSLSFLTDLVTDYAVTNFSSCEELIAQGNMLVINRKLYGLCEGEYGYEKDPTALREFNESLVEKSDQEAIRRKIDGLCEGKYGYERDPTALREFNESLVEKGDREAIRRKIDGLCEGKYGYERDPTALREFNESLVEKGDREAIRRKIDGLCEGKYGYEKDPTALREFNESLVEKSDQGAIKRKIHGLERGWYGYEKDSLASTKLNEFLVGKGDSDAIERKIDGLCEGKYGYEKDSLASRKLNEFLVEKGDLNAMERKIDGLCEGKYGYERDPLAAREFNEFLINKGDEKAFERKIAALNGGGGGLAKASVYYGWQVRYSHVPIEEKYGYKRNLNEAREFNEYLVQMGDLNAIERKLEGLYYEDYGYKRDRVALKEFNELLIERGNLAAIKRKIKILAEGNYRGDSTPADPDYGYEKNPTAAKEYIKLLVTNNPESIYKMDLPVTEETYEVLVKGGNINAIGKYMEFLSKGNYMDFFLKGTYDSPKNPLAAREFIENLIMSEIPHVRAIGKYIKAFAMKYGIAKLGYEKDSAKAIEFIKHNLIPY